MYKNMENSNTTDQNKASNLALALKNLLDFRFEAYYKSGEFNSHVAKAVFGADGYFGYVYGNNPTRNHIDTEGDMEDIMALLLDKDWVRKIKIFATAMYELEGYYNFALYHPQHDSLSTHSQCFSDIEDDYKELADSMTTWVWG